VNLEVNLGLKRFKDEKILKKELSSYVPVTMDELMDRFVHNMKRNEHQEKFTHSRKVLDQPDILKETEE
jgi:hypothetical protein